MMKLTKDDIQFIDRYLEYSDVIHIDIRMEMLDHVASTIEAEIEAGDTRSFYYICKDYMINNKAKLLHNNKQFLKSTDKKLTLHLFKQLIAPQGVLVFLGTFTLLYILGKTFNIDTLLSWIIAFPVIGFIIFALGYFLSLKFLKLKRFSAVERISFVFNTLFYLFHFIWMFSKRMLEAQNAVYIFFIVSLAFALLFALVKVTISMIVSYQTNFKKLI